MDFRKRAFDLIMIIVTLPIWLSAFVLASALALIANGRPLFYRSTRRVWLKRSLCMTKFRTMVRDAEQIANRDLIPVTGQRFLNLPPDSPLYTPIGRLFEQCCLTELPQVFHVIAGQMTIVGNRPLPENVIASLREAYPFAERRFDLPAGLTGPTQLVGRDALSDRDRLTMEILYCVIVKKYYTFRLDFNILLYTVLIALRVRPLMTEAEVLTAMWNWSSASHPMSVLTNHADRETAPSIGVSDKPAERRDIHSATDAARARKLGHGHKLPPRGHDKRAGYGHNGHC